MIQSFINHVVFVLDESFSMQKHTAEVIRVFDAQIAHLARRSKELDQETRVSVYTFADTVRCLVYDKDVLRLPSLAAHYKPDGNTALIKGVLQSIEDLAKTATLYGDHAFLIYAVTDGEENRNRDLAGHLAGKIKGLPENWTFAMFVPNATGVHEAKKLGFSAGNISVWNADSKAGISESGEVMQRSTDTFMRARSTGVRGTKNLFDLDVSKVSTAAVRSSLTELSPRDYSVFPVSRKVAIKDFVESWTKPEPYRIGSAYYPLTKPESVQYHKQICIQNKQTGKVYGGSNARQMLGLPDHEVKVTPASHPDWNVFVQSTSTNRNLVPGTNLLVMK